MMTLRDLVRAEREKDGSSLRQVADRSGGLLSSSTLHAIETGARTVVGDDTLDGIAKAFDLPIEQVQRAAGVAHSDTDQPFVLPKRANRLTRRERDHVLELVDLLLQRRAR